MTDHQQAQIEADSDVPIIRIVRDFAASPAQLYRAHTDPDLYARWVGPNDITTRIDHWDCRTGGSWAFSNVRGDESYSFHGCFHEISPTRLVQTFTFDGWPDGVSLETLTSRTRRGRAADHALPAPHRRLRARGRRGSGQLEDPVRHRRTVPAERE